MRRVAVVLLALCVALPVACSSEETIVGAGGTGGTGATTGTGATGTGGSGATTGSGGGSGGSGAVGAGGTGAGATGGGGTDGGPDALPPPTYLVSVDHDASPSRLLKIDLQTGAGTEICQLPGGYDNINYHSTTFSRNGILFASDYENATLDIIDPCTCDVTIVGPTGYGAIPGITADYGIGLFGIDTTNDLLLAIDPAQGTGTEVGPLGYDFSTSGATWSDDLANNYGGLYGINGATDQLYTIDRDTGAATPLVTITGVTFGSVGVELHPFDGEIYACTSDAVLYQIDPVTGVATAIGNGMGHVVGCNNLAAPWIVVPCLQ